MTDFDRLYQMGKGYKPIYPRTSQGTGPTPLNYSMPIGQQTLSETETDNQRRALQALEAARERGAPIEELRRLEMLAGPGGVTPNPIQGLFNALSIPADLLRFGVMDILPGGVNPSTQDYTDILTLNKDRMIQRHLAEGATEWGKSGEFRGTDILEKYFNWDYSKPAPGPWDEAKGFLRFLTATGIDIFSDPTSYFTFGAAGFARAATTQAAELTTTKAIFSARKLLSEFGDDALDVSVRTAAKEGTSPLILNAAERIQVKARHLAGTEGWKSKTPDELIDEVTGLRTREELLMKINREIGDPGDRSELLFDVGALEPLPEDAFAGAMKDAMGGDTVWADMNFEVGDIVARKQFHNRSQVWEDYTSHVLDHTEQRNPALVGSIGGASFQVPFVGRTARSLGWIQRGTRGTFTQVTRRGGGVLEKVGMTGPILKFRQAIQRTRVKHGTRQAEVMTLRDRALEPEARRAAYLQLVQVRQINALIDSTVAHLQTAVGVDQRSRELARMVSGVTKNATERDDVMRVVARSYIHDARDPLEIGDFPVDITQPEVDRINRTVKSLRKLQQSAEKAYAALDPRFRDLLNASNRVYTPLRIAEDLEKVVITHRQNFDRLFREFNDFRTRPTSRGLSTRQVLEGFAKEVLGPRVGLADLDANDISMLLHFVSSFTGVRKDPGLIALGDTDVLRLRTLGATARVIEEVDEATGAYRLRSIPDFQDLAKINSRLTRLMNEYLPDQAKVADVFVTEPGTLVHHWITSIHSAVKERLFLSMLNGVGAAGQLEKLLLTDMILNRYARNGVIENLARFVNEIWDAYRRVEGDAPLTAVQWQNLINDHAVDTIHFTVAGVDVPIAREAFQNPEFAQAVQELDEYLADFKASASVEAAALRLLLGERDMPPSTPDQIYAFVTQHLQTRYRAKKASMVRTHRQALDEHFGRVEEVVATSGGNQETLLLVKQRKQERLQALSEALNELEETHARELDELNRAALDESLNEVVAEFVADLKSSPVEYRLFVTDAGDTLVDPEQVGAILDLVVENTRLRITELAQLRDLAPPQLAARLGVELNEFRRITEGIPDVPARMVTGGRQTDAGFNIPDHGSADVWIEYQQNFFGDSIGEDGIPIPFVVPEGARAPRAEGGQRTVSTQFPQLMGWRASEESVQDWWRRSFTMIDYGVYQYNGDFGIPFYILSDWNARHSEVLHRAVANAWHTANLVTGADQDLAEVRIHGLTSTGMLPSGEAAAPQYVLDAISRLREGRAVGRGDRLDTARHVAALDLWEAEIEVLAAGIAGRQGVSTVVARDMAKRQLTWTNFLQQHGYAIRYPPGYVRSFQAARTGERITGRPSMRRRPPEQGEVAAPRTVFGFRESDQWEREVLVEVPGAHRYNLGLAQELGWEDVDAEDPIALWQRLVDVAEDPGAEVSIEPMSPFQMEPVPVFPVSKTLRARELGARKWYSDEYLEWIEREARSIAQSPEMDTLINSIDVTDAAVRQLEDLIENTYGRSIDEILDGRMVIAWEQIPTDLPTDLKRAIRGAHANRFGMGRAMDLSTWEMMLELREVGWYPDADQLAYIDSMLDDDMFIGQNAGMSERLQAFVDSERITVDVPAMRGLIDERWDDLVDDLVSVVNSHRSDGSPSLAEGDNPFWEWLLATHPGIHRRLARVGGVGGEARGPSGTPTGVPTHMGRGGITEEAGRRLLDVEARLNQAEPGDEGFRSIFEAHGADDPASVFHEFYRRAQEGSVDPAYVPVLEWYEAQVAGQMTGDAVEYELVLAIIEATFPEMDDVPYALIEEMAENFYRIAIDRRMTDAIDFVPPESQRIGQALVYQDSDFEAMDMNVHSGRLEDEEEAAGFEDIRDPDDTWDTDETMEFVNPEGATFNVDDVKTMFGSGLKPYQELLAVPVNGEIMLDLEHIIIRNQHKRRFYRYYEPPESRTALRNTYQMQDPLMQTEAPPPAGLPNLDSQGMPTTDRIVEGRAGFAPPGIDETMADEYGNPQQIELDPRERYPNEMRPGRSETIDVVTPGGGPPRAWLGQTEEMSDQPFVLFQEQLGQIRSTLETGIRFPARNLQRFMLGEEMADLTANLDGMFELLRPPDRRTHQKIRQFLTYMGVDWIAAEEKYNAFKLTGETGFLFDPDVRRYLAVMFGLSRRTPVEQARALEAAGYANLDIANHITAADRLAVRAEIGEVTPPPSDLIPLVARSTQSTARTEVVGVSGPAMEALREQARTAQRQIEQIEGLRTGSMGTQTGFGSDPSGINVGRGTSGGAIGTRSAISFGNPWSEGTSSDYRPPGFRFDDDPSPSLPPPPPEPDPFHPPPPPTWPSPPPDTPSAELIRSGALPIEQQAMEELEALTRETVDLDPALSWAHPFDAMSDVLFMRNRALSRETMDWLFESGMPDPNDSYQLARWLEDQHRAILGDYRTQALLGDNPPRGSLEEGYEMATFNETGPEDYGDYIDQLSVEQLPDENLNADTPSHVDEIIRRFGDQPDNIYEIPDDELDLENPWHRSEYDRRAEAADMDAYEARFEGQRQLAEQEMDAVQERMRIEAEMEAGAPPVPEELEIEFIDWEPTPEQVARFNQYITELPSTEGTEALRQAEYESTLESLGLVDMDLSEDQLADIVTFAVDTRNALYPYFRDLDLDIEELIQFRPGETAEQWMTRLTDVHNEVVSDPYSARAQELRAEREMFPEDFMEPEEFFDDASRRQLPPEPSATTEMARPSRRRTYEEQQQGLELSEREQVADEEAFFEDLMFNVRHRISERRPRPEPETPEAGAPPPPEEPPIIEGVGGPGEPHPLTREEAVEYYSRWLNQMTRDNEDFAADVADLSGQRLLCPGRPHEPCHAGVLAAKADQLFIGSGTTATLGISGAQDGADRMWLEEVAAIGGQTGGTAPPGYATSSGSWPEARDLGVGEYDRADYDWDPTRDNLWVPRTEANVFNSDGTIWFGNPDSPGGQATRRAAVRFNKPFIINPHPTQARMWMQRHGIRVVNGAGNRSYTDRDNIRAVVRALFTPGEDFAGPMDATRIFGPIDIGRHNRPDEVNLGVPFYVADPRTRSQFRNRAHPFYKRRVRRLVGRPEETVTRTVGVDDQGRPITETVREPAIPAEEEWETVLEPVMYEEVASEGEAARRYYDMLWDMIEDPEIGPATRAFLDTLHGRLLYRYASGGAEWTGSKVQDGQILADAVDWLHDGKWEQALEASRLDPDPNARITGRPAPTGVYPYFDPESQDVIERAMSVMDTDSVDELYANFWSVLEAADEKEIELARAAMMHSLQGRDDLIQSLFDPRSTKRDLESSHLGQWLAPILDAGRALKDRLGLTTNGYTEEMFAEMLKASQKNPVLTVLTEAAREVHGSHAIIRQIVDGESVALRVDKPMAEQYAHHLLFDHASLSTIKGVPGNRPTPISLTFREIDEMGQAEAQRRGLHVSWELAQASRTLTERRDRIAASLARIEERIVAGDTGDLGARRTNAQGQLEETDRAIALIHKVMDEAWDVSMKKDNRRFRAMMGVKRGSLWEGDRWDEYQEALSLLPDDQRHVINFLVGTALNADLFPTFDDFANEWFAQKNITVETVGALRSMMQRLYKTTVNDPYTWSQILTLDNAQEMPLRQLLLDMAQLISIHPRLDASGMFADLVSRIGISSRPVNTAMGSEMMGAGQRDELIEVIEYTIDTLKKLQSDSTLKLMVRAGGMNVDEDMITQLGRIAETMKVRGEERSIFGEGVPGSWAGMAGVIEEMMFPPMVLMEIQRSLQRMQLAADPRIGMEIMGEAARIMGWWTKAATVARPTFHLRNLIGGMWNNVIIGVSPYEAVRLMPDMYTFVRNRRRMIELDDWDGDMTTVIEDVLLKGISEQNKELFLRAIKAGVMDSAFSSTLPRKVTSYQGMRAWNPFNGDNKAFMLGTAGMEFVEGILRMSAFNKYYDSAFPHMSSQMAKLMVNTVHFDYSDLSNVDKVIKKFVPFWVWTSRNLPLQMRQVLGNPKMLNMYEHARENWNDEFGDPEQPGNEWLKENGWILPFRREDDHGNWVQMSWEPALPFADMLELPLFKQTFNDGGYGELLGDNAFNPTSWVGWLTGNLAPQYSALGDMAIDPREQWDRQNALPGLAAVMRALGQGDTTPQGEQRVAPIWNSLLTTGIPFYNEYVTLATIPTNSPYSAGNQGFLPNEYALEKDNPNWEVAAQQLGRGLGFHWRSPEDVYWQYKDWEAYLESVWSRERMLRSDPYGLTPETRLGRPIGPAP